MLCDRTNTYSVYKCYINGVVTYEISLKVLVCSSLIVSGLFIPRKLPRGERKSAFHRFLLAPVSVVVWVACLILLSMVASLVRQPSPRSITPMAMARQARIYQGPTHYRYWALKDFPEHIFLNRSIKKVTIYNSA